MGISPLFSGYYKMKFLLLTCLVAAVKAEADADPFLYSTYGLGAYAGYHPYAYAAAVPFGSSTGLDPITQGLDAATQGAAVPAYHYLGKRSADADADAKPDAGLLYSSAYHPYSYGAFPYYSGIRHFGKRSADADADAYIYRAAYHPYAYRAYHPYAYGAYRYW